jgi:thioredoxin reductase (NADPH)
METGARETAELDALFVMIGAAPRTEWLAGTLDRDERGFIRTGLDIEGSMRRRVTRLETSIPGVYAVGDVRAGSVKRVASAVGEGSIAVQYIHEYLEMVERMEQREQVQLEAPKARESTGVPRRKTGESRRIGQQPG